jgi:hypothetical protein
VTGLTGPKGTAGEPGAKGDTGMSGYEVVTAISPTHSNSKFLTANCPAGKKVVGGSAFWNLSGPEAVNSFPSDTGTSWSATAYEVTPINDSWQLIVRVFCVNVAS